MISYSSRLSLQQNYIKCICVTHKMGEEDSYYAISPEKTDNMQFIYIENQALRGKENCIKGGRRSEKVSKIMSFGRITDYLRHR